MEDESKPIRERAKTVSVPGRGYGVWEGSELEGKKKLAYLKN